MTELAMTSSDHTTASETCSRGSASHRDGQRSVRGNPALHARPWNKFRFLIDSSFLPLYMKHGAGGVPRRSEVAAAPSECEHGRRDDAAGSESWGSNVRVGRTCAARVRSRCAAERGGGTADRSEMRVHREPGQLE